jgi:hypothetical protein
VGRHRTSLGKAFPCKHVHLETTKLYIRNKPIWKIVQYLAFIWFYAPFVMNVSRYLMPMVADPDRVQWATHIACNCGSPNDRIECMYCLWQLCLMYQYMDPLVILFLNVSVYASSWWCSIAMFQPFFLSFWWVTHILACFCFVPGMILLLLFFIFLYISHYLLWYEPLFWL